MSDNKIIYNTRPLMTACSLHVSLESGISAVCRLQSQAVRHLTCVCPRVWLYSPPRPHFRRYTMLKRSIDGPRLPAKISGRASRRDHLLPHFTQQSACAETPFSRRSPARNTRIAPTSVMSHSLLGARRQVIVPAHSGLILVLGQHVPAAVTHFLAIFLFDPRYAVVARM